MSHAPTRVKAKAHVPTPQEVAAEEDRRLEHFEFIPPHLRHHFKREDEYSADDDKGNQAVDAARVTRSAHLTASLLYTQVNEGKLSDKAEKSRKSRVSPKKPRHKANQSEETPQVTSENQPTPPLYSLQVEEAITKRVTYERTLKELDDYISSIRITVDKLNSQSSVAVPAWIWESSKSRISLPTLLQVQRKIVQCVASCLPECDVYLAMYEPLPLSDPSAATANPLLRFAAASPRSSMLGRVIEHVELPADHEAMAISFTVLQSLDPALVDDIATAAATPVHWFGGDSGTPATGPFGCLPLVASNNSSGIGVLSIDSCRKAVSLLPEAMSPQALYEFLVRMHLADVATEFRQLKFGGRQLLQLTANDVNHRPAYRNLKVQSKQRLLEIIHALKRGLPVHLPLGKKASFFSDDEDALNLLDEICARAGPFLDDYRRSVHWLRVLAKRTRDSKTSALDVYASLIQAVANTVVGIRRVVVWKIREATEIDAIASTQLPDDRLMPFLQWNERLIRRVALYCENNDDQGRLMQGNIMRITFPPPTDQQPLSKPCERAIYHVSWSNRTQQSLTWPQLRLVLAVRPMNARHFQVAKLLQRLQQGTSKGTLWLDDPHAIVYLVKDPQRPEDVDYAVQVELPETLAENAGDSAELTFLSRAIAITQQNLACVRGRELRMLRRQQSTVKTTRAFQSVGFNASPDALQALSELVSFVFAEVSAYLPGTQCQIAELQPDGSQLRFTFAGNGSTLVGKTLNRGQGISFRCIDSRTPLVITSQSELRYRLRHLGTSGREIDLATELPYIFLPLVHEDACVGVLSVNRFVDVPKGREDEEHPEDGVTEYLTALAKPLATAIYLKRRAFAMYQLQQLANEPLQSPEQLFTAACATLKDVLIGVWKARVVELDFHRGKTTSVYDFSETARTQAMTVQSRRMVPFGYRADELLDKTIQHHWSMTQSEVHELRQGLGEFQRGEAQLDEQDKATEARVDGHSEMLARKRWERRVRQRYYRLRLSDTSADLSPASPTRQTSAAIRGRETNEKYATAAISGSMACKTATFATIKALVTQSRSAVYLAVAVLPQCYATCEQSFVDRVAESTSRMLESLIQRVERSRTRVSVLQEISGVCSAYISQADLSLLREPPKPGAFPLTPAEELRLESGQQLLDQVVRVIAGVLQCPYVYVALHEPFHRCLRYVAATDKSSMKDKVLRRGHGVSFYSLDHQEPITVDSNAALAQLESSRGWQHMQLRYFTTDEVLWPFIVVPLGRLGVLALDNLDKYERLTSERQPEIGLVDFLCRAAALMGEAVQQVRIKAQRERRRRRDAALVRVMAVSEDLSKHASSVYIQHVVLQAIESAFNGVDAYIGILQPLCSALVFSSATGRSIMEGKQVNAVDSVSFRVLLSQEPMVIPQLERRLYESSEHHTAELVERLRWFTPARAQGRKGPFVCVPIPCIGVLSVDTFPGAAGGCFSAHTPEHGVVDCLTKMAALLGSSIRRLAAEEARRSIPKLFKGNQSTYRLVFHEILQLIANNVLTAIDLRVLCYDAESLVAVHGMGEPLAALQTTVSNYREALSVPSDDIEAVVQSVLSAKSSDLADEDARCFQLPSHRELIVLRCRDTCDVASVDGPAQDLRDCRMCETVIIVRRVEGATWPQDVEFLQTLVPLIDDIVNKVNERVCGIVARRRSLLRIEEEGRRLEEKHSASVAAERLPSVLASCLDLITAAASRVPGDAYVGERSIGGSHLVYLAASSSSLMARRSIELLVPQTQKMATVQCLQDQHHRVIHLSDSKTDDKLVTPLTSKKPERVFAVLPMGEDRVFGIDSLSADAFDVQHRRLERDVEEFFRQASVALETLVCNVRYRLAYEQLCELKTRRHANLRLFYLRVHEILRQELKTLHSQQILTLATDFTGQFQLHSWQRANGKRTLAPSRVGGPHFCFVNGCDATMIAHELHFESKVQLPMTNLPRTLDASRASGEPAAGREKQGAYACDCLATMLDAQVSVSPKLALCVYSHDHVTRLRGAPAMEHTPAALLPTEFSAHQRQFFFAFASVASSVYTHVFRACVLDTFSIEMLFVLRDGLSAKDAVLLEVDGEQDPTSARVRVVANASGLQAKKWATGATITDKLAQRVLANRVGPADSPADREFQLTITKTARMAPPPAVSTVVNGVPPVNAPEEAAPVNRGGPTSFFKRRLFGGKESQKKQKESHTQQPATPSSPPPPVQIAIAECHLLVRGHHDGEILSLHFERFDEGTVQESVEADVHQLLAGFVSHKQQLMLKPTGDEEWNAAGFTYQPEIGEGTEFGGGGFCVLSEWSTWQKKLRDEVLDLETDMRSYLTGVQATSRDQLGTAIASSIRPSLLPGHHTTGESVFVTHKEAVMVLIRAALVLCGYKKEIAIDAPPEKDDDLLKEFLRAGVSRKVIDVSPRLSGKWAAVVRSANHIRSQHQAIATAFGASTAHKLTASGRAARSLWCLILALASACKYFKYQQDCAKQRRLAVDRRAIVIQCFYRVVRARVELKRRKIEYKAALTIQCAFRQYLARRRRLFLKWTRSAVTLQRMYRRKLAQRRGRRPRKLTLELRNVAAQYGTMQSGVLATEPDNGDGAWKVEMQAFDSFKAYLSSRIGRDQLKKEEHVIGERLKQVAVEREQRLSVHDRLLADVHDVFELLDISGSGELSREATRELLTRFHVPLSTEEADDVIDMMDSDRSGAISFDEFTNWFAHEYVLLRKRSRECGVLSRRDRQWIIEESAKSALRKRWLAHQHTQKDTMGGRQGQEKDGDSAAQAHGGVEALDGAASESKE